MKSISKIVIATTLLLSIPLYTQLKHAKTDLVVIYGNSTALCKTAIEKVVTVKKEVEIDWNKDTQIATLRYDTTKISKEQLLKKAAWAGYDNELFLAPEIAYNNLPIACQYARDHKQRSRKETTIGQDVLEYQETTYMEKSYTAYFSIKEALVQSNQKAIATQATALATALDALVIDSESVIKAAQRDNIKKMSLEVKKMAKAKNLEQQRDLFALVSQQMYEIMKAIKPLQPVYFQYCPMYHHGSGAYWLSLENTIQNPYYGINMLSCGKTVEIIK